MKRNALLIAVLLVAGPNAYSQNEATDAPAKRSISEKALESLSTEDRRKVNALIGEASEYVQGIRLQEALEKLMEAEQISDQLFQIHNLRGAAFTKMRDFDNARAAFKKSIELEPKAFHAKFNLSEIEFVTRDYEAAEKAFSKLMEDYPDMEMSTRRLLEYKILICKLKQDDEAAAKRILSGFSYLDDTPVYYTGNAAVAYHNKDNEDAESWIASAKKIYQAAQLDVFLDALIEAGWIETL